MACVPRVLVVLSVLCQGWAAGEGPMQPLVILTPDYGQVRRSDSGVGQDKRIVVAWPSGVKLPPRQVPLRFVAAMAVPQNTDPLLTQKELSEVVYYSNMDLRKLNRTKNIGLQDPDIGSEYYEDGDENEYYEEYEVPITTPMTPAPTTPRPKPTLAPSKPLPSPKQPKPTLAPSKPRPSPKTTTEATSSTTSEIWTTSSSSTTAVRRHWTPHRTDGRHGDEWLEAESVAYIVVGTCCGISVLTLAIVMLVFRLRQGDHVAPGTESTASGTDTASDGGSSLRLPPRLISLMNDHSQSASTHKLGSWFNGRPTALSIHGGSMAFPNTRVHNASFNEAVADFSQIQARNSVLDTRVLEEDFSSSSSDSQMEEDSLQRRSQVEVLLEEIDESVSVAESSTNSRHDTFIFWSSNSDRLV